MASISIPAERRQIDDPREIASFVAQSGLSYERWDVGGAHRARAPIPPRCCKPMRPKSSG